MPRNDFGGRAVERCGFYREKGRAIADYDHTNLAPPAARDFRSA
jgi:hypothetical protein